MQTVKLLRHPSNLLGLSWSNKSLKTQITGPVRCFVTTLPREQKSRAEPSKLTSLSRPKTIHKHLKSFHTHLCLEATCLHLPGCHASVIPPSQSQLASFWCLCIFGTSDSQLLDSWEPVALWDCLPFYFLPEELAGAPANPPGPDSKGWKLQSEWVLTCHLELMERNRLSLAGQVEVVDLQVFVSSLVLP